MRAKEAHQLGIEIATLIQRDQIEISYTRLAPALAQRTPFPMLERISTPNGRLSLASGRAFADRIAAENTEGGWVVIGVIMWEQIDACCVAGDTRQ